MIGSDQPAVEDNGAASCACAWPATSLSPSRLATRDVRVPAARVARLASGTDEQPDPGGDEEARRLGGGSRGERAARWRRPR
jgi:hypothetical protein